MISHVVPEAQEGGPIACVQEGDSINIDIEKRIISIQLPENELQERSKSAVIRGPPQCFGLLKKYALLAHSASDGAATCA